MKTLVFTANSKKGGISVATLDEHGKLVFAKPVLEKEGVAPLAVHPNQRFLYAAVRTREPNEIVSFAIDPAADTLHLIGAAPLPAGVGVAYLSVDPTGMNLLSASYAAGEVFVHAIAPGGQAQAAPLTRLHPERNPHGINCSPDGKFAFVPALGQDRVLQYRFDAASGSLTPNAPAGLAFPRNAGPRHLIFSPDRRHAYVLTELSGRVATLAFDAANGTLSHLGDVALLPPERALPASSYTPPRNANAGGNSPVPVMWAADIGATPDGRFVYASERTNSTISCFARDIYSGRLDFVSITEVEAQPRGFAIDPWGRYLLVSGEKSGGLGVFAINRDTGALSFIDRHDTGEAPNWVSVIVC